VLPIEAVDLEAGWYDEPIFEGFSLPRFPRPAAVAGISAQACRALTEWEREDLRMVDATTYAEGIVEELRERWEQLNHRFGIGEWPSALIDRLVRPVAQLEEVEVTGRSHGDLQPGNIMVDPSGEDIRIIDWEHVGTRSLEYDSLVLSLSCRSGDGMAQRLERFVEGATTAVLAPLHKDVRWRRARAHLLLLEEMAWYTAESTEPALRLPSRGLVNVLREAHRFVGGI
jgi:Ser/Thr protein kinase RdoA (MazF antagonist)